MSLRVRLSVLPRRAVAIVTASALGALALVALGTTQVSWPWFSIWVLLLLAAAVAIKLGSKGPVLFKQTRVGCGGREFTMYKFRSMRQGSDVLVRDDGAIVKGRDDDRVGGAVSVLGHDEVGLALSGGVLLVGRLAVEQDHHVGILLEGVVHHDTIGDEVVRPEHGRVVHRFLTQRLDGHDGVPEAIRASEPGQTVVVEHPRHAR